MSFQTATKWVIFAVCVSACAGLGAACGGGQPQATQPSNPAASSAAPGESAAPSGSAAPAPSGSGAAAASASAAPAAPSGPPGPGDWDGWSHEQKLAYMKSAVMPKMGAAFHDFNEKKYGEPKCVLCHGPGVKDGSFKMPNPELPKLDASPAGFKKLQNNPKKKAVFEFMGKTVVPTMAGLLGEQPFDPKTMSGFGCFNCHTKAGGGAGAKTGAAGDTKGAGGDTKEGAGGDTKAGAGGDTKAGGAKK